MNKTAMQLLYDRLDQMQSDSMRIVFLELNKEKLLDKEKEQIRTAFSEGRISFSVENGGGEFDDIPLPTYTNSTDYYNKTYNQ